MRRTAMAAATSRPDWSTPSRSARSRGQPKTAGRRARDNPACWRWRCCRRSRSAAPTAIATSAKPLRRGRSGTTGNGSLSLNGIEPARRALHEACPATGLLRPQSRAVERDRKALSLGGFVQPLLVEQDVPDFDSSPALADLQAKERAYRRMAEFHVDLDDRRCVPPRR